MTAIACFVSPHGLGHAARAAAVLAALQKRLPSLRPVLFTTAPAGFFTSSGCRHIAHFPERTDVGFVQQSALVEDLTETVNALDNLLPFQDATIARLAEQVCQAGCVAVLCDIAPLGIAVARAAGIPSILIENFTWDNLYEHYAGQYPRLSHHASGLRRWFSSADIHIQSEPVCHPSPRAAITTAPASRPPQTDPASIRRELAIGREKKMILITMGGVSERTPFLSHLAHRKDLMFVVAWGSDRMRTVGNVMCLPLQTDFYHPDLIHAADAVIGKLGYSTLAEIHHAGVPFGYISRRNYPEMPALKRFTESNIAGLPLADDSLGEGIGPDFIDRLLTLPRRPPPPVNGADQMADYLAGRLEGL